MYANFTTEAVELYKLYCLVCQEKRKRPRTTGVVKPILSNEFNFHGHQHEFNVSICSFSRTLALWMPWLVMKSLPMDVL